MIDKKDCCGCTACLHICPVKCIEMREDSEGFLYPAVDKEKCINCGRCEKVCPVRGSDSSGKETATFIGYCKNDGIRMKSSSGGIFSLISEHILKQNGVIFGAAFDGDFEVCHIAVQTSEELEKLRGSKYLQSRLENTYTQVKACLESGRTVLFTGTACQTAGLKKYLNKEYEKLYTVDVLCHGVPSPKIWKMYLADIKERYNAPIEKIEFRNKESGWKSYSVRVDFSDNRRYCVPFYKDKYMQMFLGNIDLRPSCHNCRFKDFPRISDMTVGDSWGIENYMPDMYDDKGASVIVINSKKGGELLDGIKETLNLKEAELDKALPITADSRKSVQPHPNRKKFFDGLKNGEDINKLHGYLRKSLFQKGVCFARYILKRK